MAHSIRLREPWVSQYVDDSRSAVRYSRFFNRPTGIVSGQQVFLALEVFVECSLNVSLNGQVCHVIHDGDYRHRARIDPALCGRNAIELTVVPTINHQLLPQECPRIGQHLISQVNIEIED